MKTVKQVESEVLDKAQDSTEMVSAQETTREISDLIATHRALATALEIKNALGVIILQQDETLTKLLDHQKKLANIKGRITQNTDRIRALEKEYEDYFEPSVEPLEREKVQEKGKPFRNLA